MTYREKRRVGLVRDLLVFERGQARGTATGEILLFFLLPLCDGSLELFC